MAKRPLALLIALAASFALVFSLPSSAGAKPKKAKPIVWAKAASASIHPGVETVTGGAQCTANFVFTDARNTVYLGQAAHCGGGGASNDTYGCTAPAARIGGPVAITGSDGRTTTGTLAYNSWATMQKRGEQDTAVCQYNDFALIRLPAAAVRQTNPSMPVFGGPTGVRTRPVESGARLLTYGNSSLRMGITELSPKHCIALGDSAQVYNGAVFYPDGGWAHDHYCPNVGIPGDSGSAFLDADGKATGILSFLNLAPPASNTATDIARELDYARRYGGIKGLKLALGTEPFNPLAVQ